MAKEIILGIDLGTTNSVVSYLQADGSVKVIPNPEGTMTTPSVVAFKANAKKSLVTLQKDKQSLTLTLFLLLKEKWVVQKKFTSTALTKISLHKKSLQKFLLI